MAELHVQEASTSFNASLPRVKPSPKASKIPGSFFYAASDDGTDENLLILLHGLGTKHCLVHSLRFSDTSRHSSSRKEKKKDRPS
jgi:hypothetical protein